MSMTENVESLLLEHLKRFQASQDRIERKLDEHTTRLGRIEVTLAGMRRDTAHNEEAWAEQSQRLDQLAGRLERVERRLELTS